MKRERERTRRKKLICSPVHLLCSYINIERRRQSLVLACFMVICAACVRVCLRKRRMRKKDEFCLSSSLFLSFYDYHLYFGVWHKFVFQCTRATGQLQNSSFPLSLSLTVSHYSRVCGEESNVVIYIYANKRKNTTTNLQRKAVA